MQGMTRSVALMLLALSACSVPSDPSPGLRLVVSSQTRNVDSSYTNVAFVVVNETERTVFLPRCGDVIATEVERAESDAWTNASAAICPANLRADAIRLEPG